MITKNKNVWITITISFRRYFFPQYQYLPVLAPITIYIHPFSLYYNEKGWMYIDIGTRSKNWLILVLGGKVTTDIYGYPYEKQGQDNIVMDGYSHQYKMQTRMESKDDIVISLKRKDEWTSLSVQHQGP